ncbi:hypothetical protein [Peptostreptococcus anaerobius]|uniref:hypothetical protein n=1 Tax=Peptostreptococcus anaerobius TaxID=1261 RepID=UPI0024328144|nr:hypothetical protein [Peptostreptococcus anaerobius]
MSYENGNNMYNYFNEPLKHYSKDNKVFDKALKVLYSFKPHELKYNIKRVNETFNLLLGVRFDVFAFDGKYIRIELENREKLKSNIINEEDYKTAAIWNREDVFETLYTDNPYEKPPWGSNSISLLTIYDDELLGKFEDDISYFYNCIKDYIEFYYSIENPPKSIVNIKASCDMATNNPLSLLLIRNDGHEFEIELAEFDLNYLISTLVGLKDGITEQ